MLQPSAPLSPPPVPRQPYLTLVAHARLCSRTGATLRMTLLRHRGAGCPVSTPPQLQRAAPSTALRLTANGIGAAPVRPAAARGVTKPAAASAWGLLVALVLLLALPRGNGGGVAVHAARGLRLLVLEDGPVEDVVPLVRCTHTRHTVRPVACDTRCMRPSTASSHRCQAESGQGVEALAWQEARTSAPGTPASRHPLNNIEQHHCPLACRNSGAPSECSPLRTRRK